MNLVYHLEKSSEQDLSQPEPSVALLPIPYDGCHNPDYNDAGELLVEATNSDESEPLFPAKKSKKTSKNTDSTSIPANTDIWNLTWKDNNSDNTLHNFDFIPQHRSEVAKHIGQY